VRGEVKKLRELLKSDRKSYKREGKWKEVEEARQ
jgi:hypothetical protein